MADTADARAALQQLVDDGALDLQREGPVNVFIVHHGLVPFAVDSTGHVFEVRHDEDP